MNYGRVAVAALAGWIVDGVYGFVVYGNLMAGQFMSYPGVFRPTAAASANLPVMFVGILLGMFVAAYVYAKGYDGGSGVAEGLRFGSCIGVFVIGYGVVVNWAMMNFGRKLALSMSAASLVEWILVGVTIGLVYQPAAGSKGARL